MKYIKLLPILFLLTSCVQETHLKTVTFKVNMNGLETVDKIGVRGPFTDKPWQETIYFTDDDNDGIYQGTITQKTAQNSVEFKFVNQDDQFELKDQGNRRITFEYKPENILYEADFDNPDGKQSTLK